jgi:phosphohistidine phosphatase
LNLLVIRHAIAMDRQDFHDENDDFRPLTVEGIRKMHKKAKTLRKLIERPDLLVTSPLARARQTAEILSDAWKGLDPVICEALRPDADPAEFCEWLGQHPEAQSPDATIAIVGHNPHLPALIGWFLTGHPKMFVELKKGNSCLLQFRATADKGKATMLWLNR